MSPAAFSHLRHSLKRRTGKRQQRISAILRAFANRRGGHTTVGDLSNAFDARAFGAFFIFFGGINLIPLPPGTSFFTSLPLVLCSFQLAIGRKRLWLPGKLRRIRFSPETLAMVMAKIGPPLRRLERLAQMRYWPQPERPAIMGVGWFALFLALLILSPIPLANLFPGIAVALLGVALTARDGLWLIAGILAGVAAIVLLTVLYGAALLAFLQFV